MPSKSWEASASPTPPDKLVKPIKKTPKEVVDNDDEASDDRDTPPKKPSKKPSKKPPKKPFKKPPKKRPKKSPKRIVGTDDESSDDGDGDSDHDRSHKKPKVIKLLPANAKRLRIQKQTEAQFTEAFQKIKGNKRKAHTSLKLDRYIAGPVPSKQALLMMQSYGRGCMTINSENWGRSDHVFESLKVDNLACQDIVKAGISILIRTFADG